MEDISPKDMHMPMQPGFLWPVQDAKGRFEDNL